MWIGFAALPTGMVPENGLVQKERALQMVSFQVSGSLGTKHSCAPHLDTLKLGLASFGWMRYERFPTLALQDS